MGKDENKPRARSNRRAVRFGITEIRYIKRHTSDSEVPSVSTPKRPLNKPYSKTIKSALKKGTVSKLCGSLNGKHATTRRSRPTAASASSSGQSEARLEEHRWRMKKDFNDAPYATSSKYSGRISKSQMGAATSQERSRTSQSVPLSQLEDEDNSPPLLVDSSSLPNNSSFGPRYSREEKGKAPEVEAPWKQRRKEEVPMETLDEEQAPRIATSSRSSAHNAGVSSSATVAHPCIPIVIPTLPVFESKDKLEAEERGTEKIHIPANGSSVPIAPTSYIPRPTQRHSTGSSPATVHAPAVSSQYTSPGTSETASSLWASGAVTTPIARIIESTPQPRHPPQQSTPPVQQHQNTAVPAGADVHPEAASHSPPSSLLQRLSPNPLPTSAPPAQQAPAPQPPSQPLQQAFLRYATGSAFKPASNFQVHSVPVATFETASGGSTSAQTLDPSPVARPIVEAQSEEYESCAKSQPRPSTRFYQSNAASRARPSPVTVKVSRSNGNLWAQAHGMASMPTAVDALAVTVTAISPCNLSRSVGMDCSSRTSSSSSLVLMDDRDGNTIGNGEVVEYISGYSARHVARGKYVRKIVNEVDMLRAEDCPEVAVPGPFTTQVLQQQHQLRLNTEPLDASFGRAGYGSSTSYNVQATLTKQASMESISSTSSEGIPLAIATRSRRPTEQNGVTGQILRDPLISDEDLELFMRTGQVPDIAHYVEEPSLITEVAASVGYFVGRAVGTVLNLVLG